MISAILLQLVAMIILLYVLKNKDTDDKMYDWACISDWNSAQKSVFGLYLLFMVIIAAVAGWYGLGAASGW